MPTNPAFRFAPNGANRPLHQDRQVLRAEDLALEQATQDAMLARARRYLHGWGIVAGLLPEAPEGDAPFRIGPGYGVTPTGEEVFLPGAVELPGVAEAVRACCGPGAVGCEVIDPEARAAATGGTIVAWLVARPASREGAPRPGVPPDCAHPAARLLPSRRCGGVEFALLCDLPDRHRPPSPDCEALAPFLCPPPRAAAAPLPWEAPPGADDSLLVIAQLTLADGALSVSLADRRRLLPVWMIQDWIAACLCPALGRLREEPTRPEPPPEDDDSDDPIRPRPTLTDIGNDILVTRLPDPGRDVLIDPRVTDPPPIRDDLAPLTLEATPGRDDLVLPTDEVIGIRDRLNEDVQAIPSIGETRAAALTEAGIRTEGEFLTAPPTVLAETLGVSVERVTDMKRELSTRRGLGLRFR